MSLSLQFHLTLSTTSLCLCILPKTQHLFSHSLLCFIFSSFINKTHPSPLLFLYKTNRAHSLSLSPSLSLYCQYGRQGLSLCKTRRKRRRHQPNVSGNQSPALQQHSSGLPSPTHPPPPEPLVLLLSLANPPNHPPPRPNRRHLRRFLCPLPSPTPFLLRHFAQTL